jgi:dihydrolipoamide dehydrogenase
MFFQSRIQSSSFKVTGIRGHGTISAPGQVTVKKEDGSSETLHAKSILLAVGSEVTPFPGIDVRRFDCLI